MIRTQKDQVQTEYLLSRDPMQEYFSLTCQTIKLNSPHMHHVCSINTKKLYQEAVEMNVPFYKWQNWVEDYINKEFLRLVLSEPAGGSESD